MDTNRCKKVIKTSKRALEKENEKFCQALQGMLNPRRDEELSFLASCDLVLKMTDLAGSFMQHEDKLGLTDTNKSDEEKAFVDEYKRKIKKEKQLSEKRLKVLDQMMISAQSGLGMYSPTATPEIIDLVDRTSDNTQTRNFSDKISKISRSETNTEGVPEGVLLQDALLKITNEVTQTPTYQHRRNEDRDRENRQRSWERCGRSREKRKSVDFKWHD